MSHTPGPWHLKRDSWLILAGSKPVADINSYNESAEANARLIFLAPDLLQALEEMCDVFQYTDESPGQREQVLSARAVIAKVKG